MNAQENLFADYITESAGNQTYYTIGLLVDREHAADAY